MLKSITRFVLFIYIFPFKKKKKIRTFDFKMSFCIYRMSGCYHNLFHRTPEGFTGGKLQVCWKLQTFFFFWILLSSWINILLPCLLLGSHRVTSVDLCWLEILNYPVCVWDDLLTTCFFELKKFFFSRFVDGSSHLYVKIDAWGEL